jgi:hypothetical protein
MKVIDTELLNLVCEQAKAYQRLRMCSVYRFACKEI